jgi:uncharacterized protein with NAD-binding domain and iron-sulfur cluster
VGLRFKALGELAMLLVTAVKSRVEAAGGRVRSGGLERLEREDENAVRLHLKDGEQVTANQAILASDPASLAEAGAGLASEDARFAQLSALEPLPRLDVHLSTDIDALADAFTGGHLIAMDSTAPLLLRRDGSPINGQAKGGWLQAVLPAAGDWIDREAHEIGGELEAELRRLLPALGNSPVTLQQVERRPCLSYHAPIEAGARRPAVTGALSNVYLAGEWCDTALPPTLEGAAAAGTQAAHHLLAQLGRTRPEPHSSAPTPSLLYRLLSG